MKKKTVQTRRKGFLDVTEVNALKVAYGKPLDYQDYFNYIGQPALFLAALATILFYQWWATVIAACIGAYYGYKVILKNAIRRMYEQKSLAERNKFINVITQTLADQNKTTIKALEKSQKRLSGELKQDISILEAGVKGSDKFQIMESFNSISEKYEKDVIFSQYLEQIETALYEGRNNVETLKQLKSYHNDTKKETLTFIKIKNGHFKDFKFMMGLNFAFIGMMNIMFGFQVYLDSFAHSPIGSVFGIAYFIVITNFSRKFCQLYFDDEIMSLGVSK